MLLTSCATNHPPIMPDAAARAEEKARLDRELQPAYGQPIPRRIQVYVYGPQVKNPGIYYFETGTTLKTALAVIQRDALARRLVVYNFNHSDVANRNYRLTKLSGSEQRQVLQESDCLYFPTTDL